MGAARWKALHKVVYAIVGLGLLHFFWMRAGKNDFGEWSIYAVVVAVLLGWRLLQAGRRRAAARRRLAVTS
jgi:sulfoxide reductase heme-binding subunit YedZ